MNNEEVKWKPEKESPEERKESFWQKVVEEGDHSSIRDSYMVALLLHSLGASTKSIDKLKGSMETSSNTANRLSEAIRDLTWALVIIGGIGIVLMIISLSQNR